MTLRRIVDDLVGPDGSGAADAAPGSSASGDALAEAGFDDLDPDLYGDALLHFADTAPLSQADALRPVVVEASGVPIDPELDPVDESPGDGTSSEIEDPDDLDTAVDASDETPDALDDTDALDNTDGDDSGDDDPSAIDDPERGETQVAPGRDGDGSTASDSATDGEFGAGSADGSLGDHASQPDSDEPADDWASDDDSGPVAETAELVEPDELPDALDPLGGGDGEPGNEAMFGSPTDDLTDPDDLDDPGFLLDE